MMEVRTKDKVFLALFLPAAIVGAYLYVARLDAAKEVDALQRRHDSLVSAADFPLEKRIREARVAEAEKELADEQAVPAAESRILADASSAAAWREREVMRVFSEAGLAVMRCEAVAQHDGQAAADDAMKATGQRPSPVCRRYTLEGTYPAVKRAMDAFSRSRMAVVPERLYMRSSGFARWTLQAWL